MAKTTQTPPAAADQAPVLYGLRISRLAVTVRGTSPLIVNRFPDEAIAEIEKAQQGTAKAKKPPRDPEREFNLSRYVDELGRDCIPAAAFKESMVRALTYIDGMPMTVGRGAFFVNGDLLPLRASPPFRRHDRVVLHRQTTSIAYRACYEEWEVDLAIDYQENVITAEQIINLIELSGFAVGVGGWRPACKGQFGRYEIKRAA